MQFETIVVTTLIVAAFLTFAVALAYGQIVTSNLKKDEKPTNPALDAERPWQKAA